MRRGQVCFLGGIKIRPVGGCEQAWSNSSSDAQRSNLGNRSRSIDLGTVLIKGLIAV